MPLYNRYKVNYQRASQQNDVWYVPNEGRLPRHIADTNSQHQLTASQSNISRSQP